MEVPPDPDQPFEDRPISEFDAPLEPVVPPRRRVITAVAILLVFVAILTGFAGVGLVWLPHGQPAPVPPVATPTPPLVAASSGPSGAGRLAVVGPDGALVTMDATGGSPVPVDLPGSQVSFPAWSPDGSRIAALVTDQSGATIQVVGTSPSPATEPVTIYRSTDEPPFYLSWSSDGRSVTFLTTEPGGIALRRAPADASAAATRLRDGSPMYWADLADGRLLVHAGSGAGSFLGEIAADGKDHDDGVDATGSFRAPALSVDGTYRAYVGAGTDGAAAVLVEAGDGSGHHEVPIFGPSALSFAPTGATVAFIARPSADAPQAQLPVGPLRAVDAASGSVRTLLSGSVVAFFWSPDGRTIAALRIPTSGDGIAATGVRLARAAVPVAAPGLALDLVFVDAADGSVVARQAVRVSDVFASQLLPYFDQYALSHRIWSPDSAAVALPVVATDGASEIDVIATDGSAARRVAPGVIAFWSR